MAQSPQAESNFLPHHEVKRPIDPASGNHSQPTQPPAGGTVVQNTDHQGDRTSCTQDGLSLKPEKTSFDRASAQLDNDRSELSKEQPNAKYPWIRKSELTAVDCSSYD